ncbi:hypothetical protein Rhopal_002745-T1 [Rhodotorula paludigena]|uniref:DUF605-domain-containing protein n=1 Tax=Rhodotorula paludigena TaxID=86838 RepID=A0AAV5GJS6_9BASI|nr:hypothetical protein Rhopal_002745-T1 [Rhodotorula paludigena]
MTTPAVPQELKAISPYLARANELAKPEPVISYWCTYYALQQAMSVRAQDPESQAFLLSLMDKLEETKAAHSSNEAITDDIAAAAYVENFGLKIFSQADNEDRKGKATRLTARKFLASANFLEVLSIFGEATPENREKIKYAKWKASDIAKAFREGRTPTPGPAGGLQEGDEDAVETSQVTAAEAKELSKELAELGTDDERRAQVEQGGETPAASTRSAASVGGSERAAADDDEPASYPFPQQPTQAPSAPPADLDAPDFIDEEPSHAATPAVPSFLDTPVDDPASPAPPTPVPQTHQTANLPDPGAHQPSEPPAFPSAVFPSAPSLPAQPSAPSPPPAAPARPSAPSAAASTAPSRPLAPPAPVIESKCDDFDPMTVAQVQKHAKWAISALNYDDFDTARKELRLALAMLGG